jgi:hypothetical protein
LRPRAPSRDGRFPFCRTVALRRGVVPGAGDRIPPDSRGATMTDPVTNPAPEKERIPALQHVLDNPFLLLFIGVVMPTVIYIMWGIMEILTIPISPLAK